MPDLLRAVATYAEQGDKQTMFALTFVLTNELIKADGRMKMRTERIVRLSNSGHYILNELKIMAGNSCFVFPGRNRDRPISNNTMLFALYRLGYRGKITSPVALRAA
ncbi:MAG: hypothetical protein WAX67_10180 [Rugosibacter sp.]